MIAQYLWFDDLLTFAGHFRNCEFDNDMDYNKFFVINEYFEYMQLRSYLNVQSIGTGLKV